MTVYVPPSDCMIDTLVPGARVMRKPLGTSMAGHSRLSSICSRGDPYIGSLLLLAAYSVDAGARSPWRALRNACHPMLAHVNRVANSRNPPSTASLPRSPKSTSELTSEVSRRWTSPESASASAVVFPLRLSVMIDVEAFEIAQ